MNSYGKELILDLALCEPKGSRFTRAQIQDYIDELCELIKVEKGDLHFWDYEDEPHEYDCAPDRLKGVSVVQFIMTSNITIHTLDVYKEVLINVFSCDDFDASKVTVLSLKHFGGIIYNSDQIERGRG